MTKNAFSQCHIIPLILKTVPFYPVAIYTQRNDLAYFKTYSFEMSRENKVCILGSVLHSVELIYNGTTM